MNGILELTDTLGLDFYFVHLEAKQPYLYVKSLNEFCRHISKRIILAEVENVAHSMSEGFPVLSFTYEKEHYRFVDYGNQITAFLYRTLPGAINN